LFVLMLYNLFIVGKRRQKELKGTIRHYLLCEK
jgi:hypothetical protein